MGKGGSLPYSMARGGSVYLMDPVLAFIVPYNEAVKLSEESLGIQPGFVLFFPLCCVHHVCDAELLCNFWQKRGISRGPPFLQSPSGRRNPFAGEGVKAIVACPNPAVCHQQNFPGIRLGIGVRRVGSCSREDIPQPREKRRISVDIE